MRKEKFALTPALSPGRGRIVARFFCNLKVGRTNGELRSEEEQNDDEEDPPAFGFGGARWRGYGSGTTFRMEKLVMG